MGDDSGDGSGDLLLFGGIHAYDFSTGGSLFNLVSVDVIGLSGTEVFTNGVSSALINSTGTYNFAAGFTGSLANWSMLGGSGSMTIDNLVFTAANVPELATLGLLAGSLLMLVAMKSKPQRQIKPV